MTTTNTRRRALWAGWALAAASALLCTVQPVAAQPVKLGEGTYFLAPKGADKSIPRAPFRTDAMLQRAAPTNQWMWRSAIRTATRC